MLKTMRHLGAKFKATFWIWPDDGLLRVKIVLRWLMVLGPLWFFPWVATIPLGFTVYFPYEKDGEARFMRSVGPVAGAIGLSEWTPTEDIPKSCFAAVVAAEDTRFYEHFGLDLDSIEKAWARKTKSKTKPARGASTITQQLVKNLYLGREKTYLRKLREATGAVLLESMVSKQSILTWYLNSIEFGPRIYGLEQASKYYFGRKAKDLTPFQCVALAVVLPSPNKWNSSLVSKRYSHFFTKRYSVVARRMRILEHLDRRSLALVSSTAPFALGQTATPRVTVEKELPDFPEDVPEVPDELDDHIDPFGDDVANAQSPNPSSGIQEEVKNIDHSGVDSVLENPDSGKMEEPVSALEQVDEGHDTEASAEESEEEAEGDGFESDVPPAPPIPKSGE